MDKLKTAFFVIIFLIFGVLLIAAFSRPFNKVSNRREITATVTDKTVKNDKEESK